MIPARRRLDDAAPVPDAAPPPIEHERQGRPAPRRRQLAQHRRLPRPLRGHGALPARPLRPAGLRQRPRQRGRDHAEPHRSLPGRPARVPRPSPTSTSASSPPASGGHGADSCSPASAVLEPDPGRRRAPRHPRARGGRRRPDLPEPGLPRLGPGAEAEPARRGRPRRPRPARRRPRRGRGRPGLRLRVAAREHVPLPRRPGALPDHPRRRTARRRPTGDRHGAAPAARRLPPPGLGAGGRARHRRGRLLRPRGRRSTTSSIQGLVAGQPRPALPPAPRRAASARTNPDDPCCASCGQADAGRAARPAIPPARGPPSTTPQDPINLRCFDQKRRFGIDFLYPVQRYVDAPHQPHGHRRATAPWSPNPLYAGNRSPKLVMMAGIVGVPWQDLAEAPKSLATGLPARRPRSTGASSSAIPQTGDAPRRSPDDRVDRAAHRGRTRPRATPLAPPSARPARQPHQRPRAHDPRTATISSTRASTPGPRPSPAPRRDVQLRAAGHRHQPRSARPPTAATRPPRPTPARCPARATSRCCRRSAIGRPWRRCARR